ncbi:MAG: hypothetical protein FIB07_03070 [Candidatus Methanoperedens sp.]|nr:hypothetical protein [Candidatus Methanoperedens sp.]
METYTKEQILELLRKRKIAERKQEKINKFFREARAEHLRNEQIRLQKEAIERAKKQRQKITWGNRVW